MSMMYYEELLGLLEDYTFDDDCTEFEAYQLMSYMSSLPSNIHWAKREKLKQEKIKEIISKREDD